MHRKMLDITESHQMGSEGASGRVPWILEHQRLLYRVYVVHKQHEIHNPVIPEPVSSGGDDTTFFPNSIRETDLFHQTLRLDISKLRKDINMR